MWTARSRQERARQEWPRQGRASRHRARPALLLAVAGVALPAGSLAAPALRAQGAVSGQITLLERADARTEGFGGAVVYLEPAGGAGPAAGPTAETIAMRGREFIPRVRVVGMRGAVAFPNQDPFSHNVFSNTAFGSFDLGLYRRGATRSATFDQVGVYPVYCNIHARMVAFVVAIPAPYFAQPDTDGRFTIRGVPAGAYVMHAWHERAGTLARTIEVPAAGVSGLQLEMDARAYVAAPHLNKFGLPYTTTRADRY